MKAAIYCRVSTHDQREEGTSLETQRAQCLAKARSLGWDVSEAHMVLDDWTGTDLKRPGLLKLLSWADGGEIGDPMAKSAQISKSFHYTYYDMLEQRSGRRMIQRNTDCPACLMQGLGDLANLERYSRIGLPADLPAPNK